VLEEASWQVGQLVALQSQASQLGQTSQRGDFNASYPIAAQLSARGEKIKSFNNAK